MSLALSLLLCFSVFYCFFFFFFYYFSTLLTFSHSAIYRDALELHSVRCNARWAQKPGGFMSLCRTQMQRKFCDVRSSQRRAGQFCFRFQLFSNFTQFGLVKWKNSLPVNRPFFCFSGSNYRSNVQSHQPNSYLQEERG